MACATHALWTCVLVQLRLESLWRDTTTLETAGVDEDDVEQPELLDDSTLLDDAASAELLKLLKVHKHHTITHEIRRELTAGFRSRVGGRVYVKWSWGVLPFAPHPPLGSIPVRPWVLASYLKKVRNVRYNKREIASSRRAPIARARQPPMAVNHENNHENN